MGLIKTVGTVAVASAVHGRIQRRQQQRWAAQDLAAAQAAGYATAPAAPHLATPPMPADSVPAQAPAPEALSQPPGSSRIEQLTKLGELRQSGVLTEEEFQREKDRVLRG